MKRYCFIGASITEGMGDETNKGWVGNTSVSSDPNTVVYNLGIRGQTIFQINERAAYECKNRLLNKSSSIIILGAALNEVARLENGCKRHAWSEIIDCYSNVIDTLKKLCLVQVVGPTPVLENKMPFYSVVSQTNLSFNNRDIEKLDAELHRICIAKEIQYIPVYHYLAHNNHYIKDLADNDGIHPNTLGYQAMAEFINSKIY